MLIAQISTAYSKQHRSLTHKIVINMKVTNRTAYATIGCDVQLSENDRLALGIELDKVTNWLDTVIGDKSANEDPYKAINNLASFISKFAIRPSQSNVFTDSPKDFKKADETT